MPDFTPVPRRHVPERPLVADTPFQNVGRPTETRYGELLEQAKAVASPTLPDEESDEEEDEEETDTSASISASDVSVEIKPAPRPSMSNRVTGLLFSYLPTLSSTTVKPSLIPRVNQRQLGLPAPPPHRPRTVATPKRKMVSRPRPPKELVNLHIVPEKPVEKVEKVVPKRLVDLVHVPTPAVEKVKEQKPRRSSGSVKDLVKSFEDFGKKTESRRVVGKLGNKAGKPMPVWR